MARLGVEADARSARECRSGTEAAKAGFAVDLVVWVVALALAWWCARRARGRRELPDRGRLLDRRRGRSPDRGDARGHAVWRLHGVDGVLAAPAELDMLRVVAAEPRTLALQVMPPRRLARPACSRCCARTDGAIAAGGRESQRSDGRRPAVDSGRPLSGAGRGRRVGGMADARDRAGSVRASERGARLAGPADRDRVSGGRSRAHRPGRRRRAPRRPPRHRRAAVDRAGERASDRSRRPSCGEVRGRLGVLSRRSQLRGARGVLGRRKPAVDVRRATRPAATVDRSACCATRRSRIA